MDEFNEMLKCSKLKTRAIFYVFYHPGISLDVHPLGLTIFSVLTRIIFKVNPIIELPFSINYPIPTIWVILCPNSTGGMISYAPSINAHIVTEN